MNFTSSTSLSGHRSPFQDVASTWDGKKPHGPFTGPVLLSQNKRSNTVSTMLIIRDRLNHGRVQQGKGGGREELIRDEEEGWWVKEGGEEEGVQVTYFCREI